MKTLDDRSGKYFLVGKTSLIAALFLLNACAQPPTNWDARFGDTVRMAIAQQTLEPEASKNTDPVAGIDGRAAGEALERYQESFQKPPPPPPLFQIMTSGSGR
jgi:hypothetical protein